jgi:hypothetical protein
MRKLLHILTKENDSLGTEIIAHQRQHEEFHVEVIDLSQPQPDYAAILEKVFDADSVQVW